MDGGQQEMGKRTKMGSLIHSVWGSLNIRCSNGKYRNIRTKSKCKAYDNILLLLTREELKNYIFNNWEYIDKLKRPSIDRIDSTKHYTLDNIRFIELIENIKRRKVGNSYVNGPKSTIKRGIKKARNGKFYARICINRKERHIGTFETAEEAYEAFKTAYEKYYNTSPW